MILLNNDILPIIYKKNQCCLRHLCILKLCHPKINNYIIQDKDYYKLLAHLTKDKMLFYKNNYEFILHKYSNIQEKLVNCIDPSIMSFDTESDDDLNEYDYYSSDDIDIDENATQCELNIGDLFNSFGAVDIS